MKKTACEFDHLPNSTELKNTFFDENDPRSTAYVRCITRPKINWLKFIIAIITPFIVVLSFSILTRKMCLSSPYFIIVLICFCILYCFILSKKAIITFIRMYQRFAPESVRNKCRFEPSCSEYMILAIEKYGLFKGIHKGIERLKRCNINGGGYDYP